MRQHGERLHLRRHLRQAVPAVIPHGPVLCGRDEIILCLVPDALCFGLPENVNALFLCRFHLAHRCLAVRRKMQRDSGFQALQDPEAYRKRFAFAGFRGRAEIHCLIAEILQGHLRTNLFL